MKKALILYTNGTEDIEATAALDILHRGGIRITTAAVTDDGTRMVSLAHGSVIVCNLALEDVTDTFDLIVVPGGPGTPNLAKNKKLLNMLEEQKAQGRFIGAICAAPGVVLYANGIIDDNTEAACYPGCECGKKFSKKGVAVSGDGTIITARSANYAIPFGLELLKALSGKAVADKIASDLLVTE